MDLKMDDVYIFSYSKAGSCFETRLAPSTPTNINHALLRARLNSCRGLTVYAVKLSEKEHKIFQENWNDLNAQDLFKQLKDIGVVEIPW